MSRTIACNRSWNPRIRGKRDNMIVPVGVKRPVMKLSIHRYIPNTTPQPKRTMPRKRKRAIGEKSLSTYF